MSDTLRRRRVVLLVAVVAAAGGIVAAIGIYASHRRAASPPNRGDVARSIEGRESRPLPARSSGGWAPADEESADANLDAALAALDRVDAGDQKLLAQALSKLSLAEAAVVGQVNADSRRPGAMARLRRALDKVDAAYLRVGGRGPR